MVFCPVVVQPPTNEYITPEVVEYINKMRADREAYFKQWKENIPVENFRLSNLGTFIEDIIAYTYLLSESCVDESCSYEELVTHIKYVKDVIDNFRNQINTMTSIFIEEKKKKGDYDKDCEIWEKV